jgi:hypothetical protein
MPFRRVTKPPQDPGCGRRTDERSTGDVIFEDWRARSIASATERVTAAKGEQCEHVSRPDDSDRHAHRNAQRHERALCVGCARCRFRFTHDEHCATHDAPRRPHPGLCGAASGPWCGAGSRCASGLPSECYRVPIDCPSGDDPVEDDPQWALADRRRPSTRGGSPSSEGPGRPCCGCRAAMVAWCLGSLGVRGSARRCIEFEVYARWACTTR